ARQDADRITTVDEDRRRRGRSYVERVAAFDAVDREGFRAGVIDRFPRAYSHRSTGNGNRFAGCGTIDDQAVVVADTTAQVDGKRIDYRYVYKIDNRSAAIGLN